ncbi:MAG: hypothetical protein OHK0029_43120 [Armatimonadaceae bacterium]
MLVLLLCLLSVWTLWHNRSGVTELHFTNPTSETLLVWCEGTIPGRTYTGEHRVRIAPRQIAGPVSLPPRWQGTVVLQSLEHDYQPFASFRVPEDIVTAAPRTGTIRLVATVGPQRIWFSETIPEPAEAERLRDWYLRHSDRFPVFLLIAAGLIGWLRLLLRFLILRLPGSFKNSPN